METENLTPPAEQPGAEIPTVQPATTEAPPSETATTAGPAPVETSTTEAPATPAQPATVAHVDSVLDVTADQHALDRAAGEGMLPDPTHTVAAAQEAHAAKTVAERLAGGETVEVGGVLTRDYTKAQAQFGAGSADCTHPDHLSLVAKVQSLAHKCGIRVDDMAHGLVDTIHEYVGGLHNGIKMLHEELYLANKRADVAAAAHLPVPDGVYDNSLTEFREWYVGDKLQFSIAKDALDFVGTTVPYNLRGKWGTRPDMPGSEPKEASVPAEKG